MATGQAIWYALVFGIPVGLLLIGYVFGTLIERRHFASIRNREATHRRFPVTTFEALPPDWQVRDCTLVSGNVVISLDHFKRLIASLRTLFGGRITTYEPLLDRARREALLRVIEQARRGGYDALINVRLETSHLANTRGENGTAGIEILAFGTALRLT